MSLSRAFTTRRAKANLELGDSVKRSNTLHKAPSQQHVLRTKISAPVQLVHTTNMLSYNAPDLPRRPSANDSLATSVSTSPLTKPEDDSDTATTISTPPTSPDEEKLDTCKPLANHLSSYFVAPEESVMTSSEAPPAIPKRSPSHTKKSSYDVARKRSISRHSKESDRTLSTKGSMSFSRSSSVSTRASTMSHASSPQTTKLTPPPPVPAPTFDLPIQHPSPPARSDSLRKKKDARQEQSAQTQPQKTVSGPFGNELAQVTELAEEFGAHCRMDVLYEDEQYLITRGLSRMTADDYLNDIHSLMSRFFPETQSPTPMSSTAWI